MSNRKKSLEAMLESLIKNDNEKAAEYLHDYITTKTREIMMGESDDKDDDKDSDDKDDDKDSDDKDDDKDSDDKDDDKDSDDKDDDDGKPDFLKKKVDEGDKSGHTESSPSLKDQPMKGTGGKSKMSKYKLSGDSIGDGIKGDALKKKGKKETKAFKETPKDVPDYKDGVDHKAGDIKNRSKAG